MRTKTLAELRSRYRHPRLRSVSLLAIAVFCADSALAQVEPPKHCENPIKTEIRFTYSNGDSMLVVLERHKDPQKCVSWCISGGAVYYVNHGEAKGRIIHAVVADGELFPPGTPQGFRMRLIWQPPYGSEPNYVIGGLGEAGSFKGVSNSGTLSWTAETTPGCARWPDGPNPITRPPVSDNLTPGRAGSVEAIAPGPRITTERDRAIAIFDSWVPNPQLSPAASMPVSRDGAVRVLKGDPIPSPGVSPSAPMPLGSSSISRTGVGGGTDGVKQPGSASSSGFYGSYGNVAARSPQSSSGIYGPYAPNNMSSSGSSLSYTPKDNAQTIPSGSAVARPPTSSSGSSLSYTPKDASQPSGGAATSKQSSLSNSNQVDPSAKIRKIRPLHRSTGTSMSGNMPTGRTLGPANATVMKPTNNAQSGIVRGTRFRRGDAK